MENQSTHKHSSEAMNLIASLLIASHIDERQAGALAFIVGWCRGDIVSNDAVPEVVKDFVKHKYKV